MVGDSFVDDDITLCNHRFLSEYDDTDNQLEKAQDLAHDCAFSASATPENFAGFALEVAMATFKGHTQPLQSEMTDNSHYDGRLCWLGQPCIDGEPV